jgi:aromatic ring hydroxylase
MCRSTDGPAEVQGVLERLREMVGLVNEAATAAAAAEAEPAKPGAAAKSPAAARPAARVEESGVARLASMTSGLFARLSRAASASAPASRAAGSGGRSK